MRFRCILDFFRSRSWSSGVVGDIEEMLRLGAAMFDYVAGVLVEGKPDEDSQEAVYDQDRRINELQRAVRRQVASRLEECRAPTDIPSGLIFTNVVKDIERIGDYVKNLYEIVEMLPEGPDREVVQTALARRTEALRGLFLSTREAFAACDQVLAREVIHRARLLGKEAEVKIAEVSRSELATPTAVCIVLGERFCKRLAMHMANIVTGVVMPVDQLDFFNEEARI